VFVRAEWRQSATYIPAPDAYNRATKAGVDEQHLSYHRYFRIPSTLWTNGQLPATRCRWKTYSEIDGTP
jgi:hypothetical protein